MKLFVSYPSDQRPVAEALALALEAEGHDVFFDRADLHAGEPFHQPLRESIEQADGFIFLVSPSSVAHGSYARAELAIAQERWRKPGGHILPVVVEPTPMSALPAYLSAVTVLEPRGDAVAETVAAVARLARAPARRRRQLAIAGAAGLAASLAVVAAAIQRHNEHEAAQQAMLQARRQAMVEASNASRLCEDGSHAPAFATLNDLAAREPLVAEVLDERENCAMRWLRGMRAVEGRQTFGEQVAVVEPVLAAGLSRASGVRAADLRSHIGWGEYLRAREGSGAGDPVSHWNRALTDDAGNVYAHAMLARHHLDRPKGLDLARQHFKQAADSGRERGFVRALQFGGALGRGSEAAAYAVSVADEMRRAGEPLDDAIRARLWSYAFNNRMLFAEDRITMTAELSPANLLATFHWLFPAEKVPADQRPMWRFVHATLLANHGDHDGAYAELDSLARELRAARRGGRLLDETQRALDRVAPLRAVR
jgi:hypothetical protein